MMKTQGKLGPEGPTKQSLSRRSRMERIQREYTQGFDFRRLVI